MQNQDHTGELDSGNRIELQGHVRDEILRDASDEKGYGPEGKNQFCCG